MTVKKEAPLVVIFGRTNVGKSTLFNCLAEKRNALVSDTEGTTRDSNIGKVEWSGKSFKIVDTGGIMDLKFLSSKKIKPEDNNIDGKVQKQARDYLKRADLILFLVDTRIGILPQDKQMALALKKIIPDKDKILLVANKADSPRLMKDIAEFNKLGLGEPIPISATTGSGTGDLLDVVVKKVKPRKNQIEVDEEIVNVSIIGKPNVGKSSLVNAILGEDRIIVSPIAHTTREPQDTLIEYNGKKINLIDTAGISRRGQQTARRSKYRDTLEKFSISKSLSTIRKADVALFVFDVNDVITHQDAKIIEEITKQQTSLILIANKWDLVKDKDTKLYTKNIYDKFSYAHWAPLQFTSALTGAKVKKVLDIVLDIAEARKVKIQENPLNKFLGKIIKKHRPTKSKGTKHPYIYELEQTGTNPPRFMIRIGAKDTIHYSYVRFIENRLREKFGFLGTPIYVGIKKNRQIHGQAEENLLKAIKKN